MTAGWDTDAFCSNIQFMKSTEISGITGVRRPVRDAESQGVRLMTFLSTHQAKIMARERTNKRFVHLYGIGDYWMAFERSAYLLCQLFSRSETSVVHFIAYPFPVMMAAITDQELKAYSRSHIFKRDEGDYKELLTSEISPGQYRLWHRNEVQDYL